MILDEGAAHIQHDELEFEARSVVIVIIVLVGAGAGWLYWFLSGDGIRRCTAASRLPSSRAASTSGRASAS